MDGARLDALLAQVDRMVERVDALTSRRDALTPFQRDIGGVVVNGQTWYFNRITRVESHGKGRYTIYTKHNGTFVLEGGRHRGGTHSEWFLDGPGWSKSIFCTSVLDACRLIEGM